MFSPESTKLALDILQNEIPFAIWETVYVTIISTFLALVVGLPLGVLLVVGEKDGILPLPKFILSVLNAVINLLRSIPFLILMIMVFPVTRFFAHTVVGTVPTIVPLVFAAFPFVARLVESSLRGGWQYHRNRSEHGGKPFSDYLQGLIPESVPSLISNITIALTTVLSYSAMSGIIGGGGLGKIAINYGYYRSEKLVMFIAVFLLIVLVQIFQTVGTRMAINEDKRIRR